MNERVIVAKRSLHARPASMMADLAARFDCEIRVVIGERKADAKSVLSLMTLDLEIGDEVTVTAVGADGPAALEAIAGMLGSPEDPDA
jgi:phosphotransferase system HPr (HPr) family protein